MKVNFEVEVAGRGPLDPRSTLPGQPYVLAFSNPFGDMYGERSLPHLRPTLRIHLRSTQGECLRPAVKRLLERNEDFGMMVFTTSMRGFGLAGEVAE